MTSYQISRDNSSRGKQPDLVGHDVWAPDRYTGRLELVLQTGQAGVSPGTGKLGLDPSGQVLVQAAARCGAQPVLAGSGIKGAARTRYEMITDSCVLFSGPGGGGSKCKRDDHCAACSLFGCMGWSGRVDFSDGLADGRDAVRVAVGHVAIPYPPRHAHGEFRVYDGRPSAPQDRHGPVEKATREVYHGRFRTVLRFRNGAAAEMGRLLLAMGFDAELGSAFPLMLGGGKYDGLGAVRLSADRLILATPERAEYEGLACAERCRHWIREALEEPSNYGQVLAELAHITGGGA